ncbi:MAG: MBL fold metallo-hydrolase [Planctomycetota bacterium]
MQVTFHGATREVTGSMHLLQTDIDRVILDCGMFQGRRKESADKNKNLPVAAKDISTVVLSHAHIDHSGRIPVLTTSDFGGRIVCTRATADACEYLLLDSGHIQESDALYLNYKQLRAHLYAHKSKAAKGKLTHRQEREIKGMLKQNKHELRSDTIHRLIKKNGLSRIMPLYGTKDAEQALTFFDGYPYQQPITIGKNMTCTFYEAGHILGSAVSLIRAKERGKSYTVCYSGDLGRYDKPIIRDPAFQFAEEDRDVDLLIMESTYGNRLHDPITGLKDELKKILAETFARRGSVIIPSFAFGRTQELIYVLHELYSSGEVARVPIYVDSPLASKLTQVFGEHPELYDKETHKAFLQRGMNPFSFEQMHFVGSLDESMALLEEKKPHIVLSASGMCEAGRILHHLRYKIHNPRNTILIVGYMAEHTLGRRIQELGIEYEASSRRGPPPLVKFLNKEYPLAAHVKELGGFSAHADRDELCRFIEKSNLNIKRIALVHGEESQSLSFAELLKGKGFDVVVPSPHDTLVL